MRRYLSISFLAAVCERVMIGSSSSGECVCEASQSSKLSASMSGSMRRLLVGGAGSGCVKELVAGGIWSLSCAGFCRLASSVA